jgi:hypothetical protein
VVYPHEEVTHQELNSHSVLELFAIGFLVVERIGNQIHTQLHIDIRGQLIFNLSLFLVVDVFDEHAHIGQFDVVVFHQYFSLAILNEVTVH